MTVIGAGYVGLVAAAGLAHVGHQVSVLERDPSRVKAITAGTVPFFEPGLMELVAETGTLVVTTDPATAFAGSEVVVIAVGTSPDVPGEPGHAPVFEAVAEVSQHLSRGVIAIKSTVPVGTCDRLARELSSTLAVVSNPEFLREGSAVRDFLEPDRVLVGTRSVRSAQVMRRLYGPIVGDSDRLQICDPNSAEMAKLAANAMLATRVSFMNELAALCEAAGADIEAVRVALGRDPRIGAAYLRPSLGWGGSCLPKDVDGLLATADQHGVPMRVVSAARQANTAQGQRVLAQLAHELPTEWGSMRIAVWGQAFKAGTDDVRGSVAVAIVGALIEAGAQVAVHDPWAMNNAREQLGVGPRWSATALDATDGAHALVLCTEWPEYRDVDWPEVAKRLDGTLVIDGRNLWDPAEVVGSGLRYRGLGRPSAVIDAHTDGAADPPPVQSAPGSSMRRSPSPHSS